MATARAHTTIGLKKATKLRLDEDRAPGQCYDGFLCQLMELWESSNSRMEFSTQKKKIAKKEVRRSK